MKSIELGHVALVFIIGFSIFMACVVILDVFVIAPKVLSIHDIISEEPGLDEIDGIFDGMFGPWAQNRSVLYTSFVVPPIIGFALAMALRRYMSKLLLKNQQLLSRDMHRPLLRWDGLGVNELRDEVSTLPELVLFFRQSLPLGAFVIVLFMIESIVFPGLPTMVVAFIATSGFTSYPTWKKIFVDSRSPRQIN